MSAPPGPSPRKYRRCHHSSMEEALACLLSEGDGGLLADIKSPNTNSANATAKPKMTSPAMAEIFLSDLESASSPTASALSITDVKQLSSYNWIESPTPTIAVPGMPALWSPFATPRQLQKDTGLVYIAQNAARNPDSPLEPLFQALHITDPTFDLNTVDVVTDRNNLRKLLSFVDPASNIYGVDPFAISIEVVNNTAIFCRQETKTYEIIGDQEFRGFGHEFEKACTEEQLAGSTGHHRIISYSFGSMKFILRHETDGFVKAAQSSRGEKSGDDLSDAVNSLCLGNKSTQPIAGSKLTVRKQGEMTPLESTLEIKTRVFHKPLDIKLVAPQLWLSQTPKLVRAYHQRGVFQAPQVEDVSGAIKAWEKENSKHLAKLAVLVRKIITVAKELGGTVMLRYGGVGDKLVLTRVPYQKKMLPEGLYSFWDDTKVSLDDAKKNQPEETSTADKKENEEEKHEEKVEEVKEKAKTK